MRTFPGAANGDKVRLRGPARRGSCCCCAGEPVASAGAYCREHIGHLRPLPAAVAGDAVTPPHACECRCPRSPWARSRVQQAHCAAAGTAGGRVIQARGWALSGSQVCAVSNSRRIPRPVMPAAGLRSSSATRLAAGVAGSPRPSMGLENERPGGKLPFKGVGALAWEGGRGMGRVAMLHRWRLGRAGETMCDEDWQTKSGVIAPEKSPCKIEIQRGRGWRHFPSINQPACSI